jgi:hypothetical protein
VKLLSDVLGSVCDYVIVSMPQKYQMELLCMLAPCVAQADLGIVLSRESQGSFVITVFLSSEAVQGRPTDVSVLVQRSDSNDSILDANVSFALTPPRGSALEHTEPICGQLLPMTSGTILGSQDGQPMIEARREPSMNKLLYAAPVNFPLVGPWNLETLVRHGVDSAKITCVIPVGLPARRLAGLAPYLALPAMLVALFATNQRLRARGSMK